MNTTTHLPPNKPTSSQIIKMLWDYKGWRYVNRRDCFIGDEIIYRDSGYYFFLDNGCIRLRSNNHPEADHKITNIITWFFIHQPLCMRICYHLRNT